MSCSRAVALFLVLASPAAAQIPDTFRNLQVFPKEIPKAQLVEEMRRFSMSTGLRCEGCHTGKGGPGLEGMDWASDEKETKRTARAMLKMVRAINGEHLARLGRPKPLEVTCATCHRGVARPVPLEDLVVAAVREKGLEAGLAAYRDLRAAQYGRAAYDFGERTLLRAAQTLLAEGKAKEAVGLVELNLSVGAKEAYTHVALADARLAAGDRPGAIQALRKALEIDPKSEPARRKLEALEKPEP